MIVVELSLRFEHGVLHAFQGFETGLHRFLSSGMVATSVLEHWYFLEDPAIDNYRLPILCSFINDQINERTQDIHDDIVFQCLTDFSRRLPCTKYNQLFISFFQQLKATNRNLNLVQKLCFIRNISAIVDALCFQATNDQAYGKVKEVLERLYSVCYRWFFIC